MEKHTIYVGMFISEKRIKIRNENVRGKMILYDT